MRKIRLFSVFTLLVLLMSAGSGAVTAQESPMTTPVSASTSAPGPNDPPNGITDADLERFVELAINEEITVVQTRAFLEQLTDPQIQRVAELLASRTGTPLTDEIRPNVPIPPPGDSEVWRQYIEKNAGPQEAFAQDYWIDPYCEGGPNPNPDDDWVFWFWIDSTDPDSLRWDTTSSQVAAAFWLFYRNNLNGFAYYWDEARLCLGTTGVGAAGGPDKVKNTTYLHH